MRRSIPVLVVTVVLLAAASLLFADTSALETRETAARTVELHRRIQSMKDEWAEERKKMTDALNELETRQRRLEWELGRVRVYNRTVQGKIREIEDESAKARRLRMELEPILEKGLDRLAGYVKSSIPFDRETRLGELERVGSVFHDPEAGLGLKTGRFLDVLHREIEFGYTVSTETRDVRIGDETVRVRLLRYGRLALWALSLSGDRTWAWDPASRSFLPLEGFQRQLAEAMDIAEKRRMTDLVELPLLTAGPR